MTNEEARIELLEEYKIFLEGCGLENEEYLNQQMKDNDELRKVVEANRMAIKALEQQPCEDCISREQAIKQCGFGMTNLLIADCLRRLPSVTPKALEQTDGDCISRKDTIEWLKKVTVTDGITFKTGFEQILYDIEQMPSVTPKAEWIPVSERLPEDYIHVLCQFYPGGMGECYYLAHGSFHVVGGNSNEVIAWMPLPEPYKAESEEEE